MQIILFLCRRNKTRSLEITTSSWLLSILPHWAVGHEFLLSALKFPLVWDKNQETLKGTENNRGLSGGDHCSEKPMHLKTLTRSTYEISMCVQIPTILAQSMWIIKQVAWGTSLMKATPVKFQVLPRSRAG